MQPQTYTAFVAFLAGLVFLRGLFHLTLAPLASSKSKNYITYSAFLTALLLTRGLFYVTDGNVLTGLPWLLSAVLLCPGLPYRQERTEALIALWAYLLVAYWHGF